MKKNSEVEHVQQHDLEIDEKLPDQIRGWKFQTVGLTFIFLIVAAAALGLFGNGLLSDRTVFTKDGIVSYDYFTRHESRTPLKITVKSPAKKGSNISLQWSYLEKFRIESIVPEPAAVTTNKGVVHYTFAGDGVLMVTFYLIPQDFGTVESTLSINGYALQVEHFVFP